MPAATPWLDRHRTELIVALLTVAAVTLRLSGNPDLMDNEQQLQSSYVMDALQNHHWLAQMDDNGQIASKPPMYTWLAATAALPFGGHINRLAVSLPSATSAVLVAIFLLRLGRHYFGERAGFLAAMAYVLSIPGVRQAGMARMDGLVACVSTLGALAAWHAWQRGRGWSWFWVAAAASTLTKSPGGAVVSAAGMLAAFFEWRSSPHRVPLWRIVAQNVLGMLLFAAITYGWFTAACAAMGQAVYDKLIREELLPQAVQKYKGVRPGQLFYFPFGFFFSRFVPWCVLTAIAAVRLWRAPAADATTRRFERFVFFWWVGGLAVFMLPAHQRADLIFPAYPPAALLAGRELARWLGALRRQAFADTCISMVVAGLVLVTIKYHVISARDKEVRATIAARGMARQIEQTGAATLPITYLDSPFALQFYLDTMRRRVLTPRATWANREEPEADYARAAQLLRGDAAAFVTVASTAQLQPHLGDAKTYDLLQHQLYPDRTLHLLSNRPALKAEDRMVLITGPITVEARGPTWVRAAADRFAFAGHGTVQFKNTSSREVSIWLRFGTPSYVEVKLPPASVWSKLIP